MTRLARTLLSASALLAASGAAQAQSTVVGEDVANRAHPEYAPNAFPIGSFDMYPTVTAGVNATDNLRASSTNKVSSAYFNLHPELNARSTWARHSMSFRAYLDQVLHPKLTAENVTTFGGSINGLYDVSRQTQFQLNLSAARAAESRLDLGSFRGTTSPVKFDQYYGSASLSQGVGRVTTVVSGTVERRNYHAARAGALVIDQSYRDLTQYGASADLKYDLGNGIGLIGTARYNKAVYDFRPGKLGFVTTGLNRNIDRRSSGFSLLGGVTLELSKLLFGSARFGYMKQTFKDPLLRNFSGFNMDVDLLWNVTALTSVRLRASRSVQDAGLPLFNSSTVNLGNSSYTRTDVSLGVNHELYRNLLLSADGSYAHFSANGAGADGDEYAAGLGLRYLMNRNISVRARVDHSERESIDPNLRYKANRGLGSIGYAF